VPEKLPHHEIREGPCVGGELPPASGPFLFEPTEESMTETKRNSIAESVVSVRMPSAMFRELRVRARREDRSMNSLVRIYIRKALEADSGTTLKTA
jgi:hypothetical protein